MPETKPFGVTIEMNVEVGYSDGGKEKLIPAGSNVYHAVDEEDARRQAEAQLPMGARIVDIRDLSEMQELMDSLFPASMPKSWLDC